MASRSKSSDSTPSPAPVKELVRVQKARHVENYVLEFTFTDGSVREIDLAPFLWGPVFDKVRNPAYLRKFRVDRESGTITWPNGADLDPDVLYLGLEPATRQAPARR